MKHILIIFLVFFYAKVSGQQLVDTIYGRVKSVREKVTFLHKKKQNPNIIKLYGDYGQYGWKREVGKNSRFNILWYNTNGTHYVNYYKEFDRNNNLILEEWYFQNQNIVKSYRNYYNELGDLIKEYVIDNQLSGPKINDYEEYYTLYSYDENKNMIHAKTKYPDNTFSIIGKSYDSVNNLISEFYFHPEHPEDFKSKKYIYDFNNNLIVKQSFDKDGKESYGQKYEYDSLNRKIKIIDHSPFVWVKKRRVTKMKRIENGIDKLRQEFVYDDENRIVERRSFRGRNQTKEYEKIKWIYTGDSLKYRHVYLRNKLHSVKEFLYDQNKRIIKRTYYRSKNSSIKEVLNYIYNDVGHLIKLIISLGDKKSIIDFDYTFDHYGNWTEQVKSVNGKRLYVWSRNIEYFQ